jgi:hypothetical protein
MHPLLANRRALAAYFAGWLVPALMPAYALSVSGPVRFGEAAAVFSVACLFHAFVCLAPYYLCLALPAGRKSIWRVVGTHLAASLVAGLFFVLVANAAASLLSWFKDLGPRIAPYWPLFFGVGFLYYLFASALHYLILAVEQAREAEMREVRARAEAREAELRALKAQLSPHFLFNSLNSISALAGTDAARARQMCVQLSDYLRGTLGLAANETIPLAREVEMLRNYLAIERVRFAGRLEFEEAMEPGCEVCPVPALLLQPLAENAVKHGISNLLEGGVIRLEARREGAALVLEMENTFDPASPEPSRSGVGLGLVRKRLAVRYGAGASLDTEVAGSRFIARVRLPG